MYKRKDPQTHWEQIFFFFDDPYYTVWVSLSPNPFLFLHIYLPFECVFGKFPYFFNVKLVWKDVIITKYFVKKWINNNNSSNSHDNKRQPRQCTTQTHETSYWYTLVQISTNWSSGELLLHMPLGQRNMNTCRNIGLLPKLTLLWQRRKRWYWYSSATKS